ncbi:MAG: PAS domain S-box protein [Deltaproteobacteria bacterium]|nr:PAS domain S-box protein [Deltaproteobacteria bacterium]
MSIPRHRSRGSAAPGPGATPAIGHDFHLFDMVGSLVVVLDRDLEVVYWNRACEELSGYTLDEVRDPIKRAELLRHYRPEIQEAHMTALAAGHDPITLENSWMTKGGERREILWRCTTRIEESPATDLVFCTGFDITPRKVAEDGLRVSEEKLSGIVTLATDAIIAVDGDQNVTVFNQGAERIFGRSSAEMLGRPLDDLLPPGSGPAHRRHIERFIERQPGSRTSGEQRAVVGRRSDGEQFPAEIAISSFTVGGQRISAAVLRDVSKRRRRETRQRFLVEAAALLASSLDHEKTLASIARLASASVADFVIVDVVDERGQVRRLEVATSDPAKAEIAKALQRSLEPGEPPPMVRRVFETRRAESCAELPPDFAGALGIEGEDRRLLERLDPTWSITIPLAVHHRMLGAIVFLGCRGGVRFGEEDLQLAEALGRQAAMAIDNARLFQAAQHATAARDDVLQVVAHELRSPLTAILFSAHTLGARAATESERRAARLINESIDEMNRLIDDLLDEKLLAAGQMVHDRQPHPCADLVGAAVEAARAIALDVELTAAVRTDDACVLVDRRRIQQVFANLIGNAIKFTPAGGRIEVGTSSQDGEVLFWVSDSGSGIAPEHLIHVFDRYWQATRDDRHGAGLGLPICKGIVEGHGGRIWAHSQLAKGSTFFFALPRVRLRAAGEPNP